MKYLPIAVILLSGVFCTAQESVNAPSTATLTVELVNQTSGGNPVAGDDVNILLYKGNTPDQVIDGKAGQDGKAVFENLPTGGDIVALPRAKHGNMSFSGQAVRLEPTSTSYSTKVLVYEVSQDNSKITVGTHHFIINASTHSLRITEYLQFNNSTDTAISSGNKDKEGKPRVIEILLPEGFSEISYIQYFQENAMKVTDRGIYDTMAIPPGTYQAALSYSLPIKANTVEITKPVNMPTAEFTVFSQLSPGRIQGLGEAIGEVTFRDSGKAEYFKPVKYKAGDEVRIQVTGFKFTKTDRLTFTLLGKERSVGYSTLIFTGVFAGLILLAFTRFIRTF